MGQKISPKTWEKIRLEYISSNVSYRELQKKYKVSYSTIFSKGKAEGWEEKRNKCREKVEERTLDVIAESNADLYKKAVRISEKLLAKIELAVDEMSIQDISTAKSITGALKDLKELGVYRGADDEVEGVEIVISDSGAGYEN